MSARAIHSNCSMDDLSSKFGDHHLTGEKNHMHEHMLNDDAGSCIGSCPYITQYSLNAKGYYFFYHGLETGHQPS